MKSVLLIGCFIRKKHIAIQYVALTLEGIAENRQVLVDSTEATSYPRTPTIKPQSKRVSFYYSQQQQRENTLLSRFSISASLEGDEDISMSKAPQL